MKVYEKENVKILDFDFKPIARAYLDTAYSLGMLCANKDKEIYKYLMAKHTQLVWRKNHSKYFDYVVDWLSDDCCFLRDKIEISKDTLNADDAIVKMIVAYIDNGFYPCGICNKFIILCGPDPLIQ